MRNKKGQTGWMAIKIDLEKAYDRLSWDFIRDTLFDIGFPPNIFSIIWHCISSPRMKLLWNGEALEEFGPSRGIRQGDPISPYLFVLCLERLFHLVEGAVSNRSWIPIRLSRRGPKISHLAFADDLLLFEGASMDQAETIKDILDSFCASFCQRVSLEKTRVFYSRNVHWDRMRDINNVLGFSSTEDLGKYLGVPILHKKVTRSTFNYVLEKVKSRLSRWKARTLSLAELVTLTKSVLQVLPTYTMQSAWLPKSICDDIDTQCRSFIWGDEDTSRKIHSVNWETVCTPKKWGVLGWDPLDWSTKPLC